MIDDTIGKDMDPTERITMIQGSGDVFVDLRFSPAEARAFRLRSRMLTALSDHIAKQGWTQAEAAKRLKLSQPRISDLVRGKISRFSMETLVNMLTDAGLAVDVRIRTPRRAA